MQTIFLILHFSIDPWTMELLHGRWCVHFLRIPITFAPQHGPRLLMDYSRKDTTFSQNLVQKMTIDQHQIFQQSLNIDTNRILPVKDSDVCPMELRRSLILWENVPLEFSRLSVDSIIISVASLGSYSCNSAFPGFVGFRMLKNLSETQHRI